MNKIYDDLLNELVTQIAAMLTERDKMLVTAESCTGGWVAKSCTDLAGSSIWFERGFVTYSNQAKQDQLAVTADTLEKHGAVSQPVVEQMAFGALEHSRADFSIAITGIAGPAGGTDEKPVGTVWIGWGVRDNNVRSVRYQFEGDRESIRRQAMFEALSGLLTIIIAD